MIDANVIVRNGSASRHRQLHHRLDTVIQALDLSWPIAIVSVQGHRRREFALRIRQQRSKRLPSVACSAQQSRPQRERLWKGHGSASKAPALNFNRRGLDRGKGEGRDRRQDVRDHRDPATTAKLVEVPAAGAPMFTAPVQPQRRPFANWAACRSRSVRAPRRACRPGHGARRRSRFDGRGRLRQRSSSACAAAWPGRRSSLATSPASLPRLRVRRRGKPRHLNFTRRSTLMVSL